MGVQTYDMTGQRTKVAPDSVTTTDSRDGTNLAWDIKETKFSGPSIAVSYALVDDGTYPGQGSTPPKPEPPVLSAVPGDTVVDVSVVNPTAGATYEFFRWTTVSAHGPGLDTTFHDSGRTNGVEYTYSAKVTTPGGTSDFADFVTATPEGSTPPPPAAFGVGMGGGTAQVATESGATPSGLGVLMDARVYRNYPTYGVPTDIGTPGNFGMFMSGSIEETYFNAGREITMALGRNDKDKTIGYSASQYLNAASTTGKTGVTIKAELQAAATRIYNLVHNYNVAHSTSRKARIDYEHEFDVDGSFKTTPKVWRDAYKSIVQTFWDIADSLQLPRNLVEFGICPTQALWSGGNYTKFWGTVAGDTLDDKPGMITWLGTDLYNDAGIFQDGGTGSRTIEWGQWTSFQEKFERGGANSLPNIAAAKGLPIVVCECACVNIEGPYDPSQDHAPTGTPPAGGSDATYNWWTAAGTYVATSAIDQFFIFNQGVLWDMSNANHSRTHQGVVNFVGSVT